MKNQNSTGANGGALLPPVSEEHPCTGSAPYCDDDAVLSTECVAAQPLGSEAVRVQLSGAADVGGARDALGAEQDTFVCTPIAEVVTDELRETSSVNCEAQSVRRCAAALGRLWRYLGCCDGPASPYERRVTQVVEGCRLGEACGGHEGGEVSI